MRVRVYRNFRKQNYSLQEKTPKGWRVTSSFHKACLKNCKFIVSQAGNKRVRATGCKNVHAYVEGDLQLCVECQEHKIHYVVHYNPYWNDTFTVKDKDSKMQFIHTADCVVFNENKVMAVDNENR